MQKVLALTALTMTVVNGVDMTWGKKYRKGRNDMPILGGTRGLPPQWVIDEFNAE